MNQEPTMPGTPHGDRPNILFLVTDQQVWYSLGVVNSFFQTPNLDRLAASGVRCTQATCTSPSCTPSRACIVTGLYPHTNTIIDNLVESTQGLPPDVPVQHPLESTPHAVTEQLLGESGYVTAHCGKWHLGEKSAYSCYDDSSLLEGQSHDYAAKAGYDAWLDRVLPREDCESGTGEAWNRPVVRTPHMEAAVTDSDITHRGLLCTGRTTIPTEMLPHTLITDETIRNIHAHEGSPWMLTASWHPPHIPWAVPEPWYSLVDRSSVLLPDEDGVLPEPFRGSWSDLLGEAMSEEGIREYLAIYAGQVAYVDHEVGRVLEALEETGQTDNTLIVFLSDHGDMQGRFRSVGKTNSTFYEELVRVPLLFSFPGMIPEHTVTDAQVSLVDLMPTLLDYAGVEIPSAVQGHSLRGLLEGRVDSVRDYTFCERLAQQKHYARMIRSASRKYIWYQYGDWYLYDLEEDPRELRNRIGDPAYREDVNHLHAALRDWMGETEDPALDVFPVHPFPT